MAFKLQLLRGTTTQVDAYAGSAGELVMDTTANQLYLFDGTTKHAFYNKVDVDGLISDVQDQIDSLGTTLAGDYVSWTAIGQPAITANEPDGQGGTVEVIKQWGVATLGKDGKIPTTQLPNLAINDVTVVADEAALNVYLGKCDAQSAGDVVIVEDSDGEQHSQSYFVTWDDVTSKAGVVEITTNAGVVTHITDAAGGKHTSDITIDSAFVGLGSVDNYATATKAEAEALTTKVQKFMTQERSVEMLEKVGFVFDSNGSWTLDLGTL